MKFVEIGFFVVLAGLFIVGLAIAIAGLLGWEHVHDKLRKEHQQDSQEKPVE